MSGRRRYSASSDDDEDGGRPRHKRRRNNSESHDIEDQLESLILIVGEKSTSSIESHLEGLADFLEENLSNFKNKIIKILCECVTEMPEKLTIYSTLVGLLNARNFTAGGEFVEMVVRHFKEAARNNELEKARVIVRFISDLVNCHVITPASLLQMYDSFMEVTLEDNIPQVRSDWYIFTILCCIPWVGKELFEKKEEEFEKLLSSIEEYISKRQKIHVPALRVWSSDNPHPQEEYIDCLWAQVQNLKGQGWSEKQILRPYVAFDNVLSDAVQHNLPHIITPSHNEDTSYPLPYIVYRMFDYTDVPEGPIMPGAHSIERYLIEENLNNIIHSNFLERKTCAAALLNVPIRSKIPLNYMIVEVIFSQLFYMPRPPYLELFYGSLLIELCRLQPGSLPQVLAQAAEMLYERIDTMNASCIDRFANWFSYHLSNFQFRWSWEDWSECLNVDPLLPKPKFVNEVLLKCMRLSYHKQIVDIMPEVFQPLLPLKPQPYYKYSGPDSSAHPGTMTATRVTQAIKSKGSADEVLTILRECPNPKSAGSDINPLKIEVFVQTLLHLGAKSFSHSFAAIAKFHQILKALGETEEAQICILKAAYELWQPHQKMMVVLVDKLLKTQVVECSAVAYWIFSPEMQHEFTSFYIWEIIHSTIKKMNRHVNKLQKDLEEAKDKLEAAQRRANDGFDFDLEEEVPSQEMIERMEEKLEAAQGEQKNLFLIIFQRFIIILTDHLARCEKESKDYNTPWYKWVIERLQQVFLMHHEQVYKYINTLENLMFTSDIDIHILEVFQQFCALRS